MDIDDRAFQIIQILSKAGDYVSGAEIAMELGVSTKTVLRSIKKFNASFDITKEYGFEIQTRQSVGYGIHVNDLEKYNTFLKKYIFNDFNAGITLRTKEMAKLFILNNRFFKISEIAERIHYSESTIANELKLLRDIFETYDLALEDKPSRGIRVVGRELNKRNCLSDLILGDVADIVAFRQINEALDMSLTDNQYAALILEIKEVFREHKVTMLDASINHFVLQACLSMTRSINGYTLDIAGNHHFHRLPEKPEFETAKVIALRLGRLLDIEIIENEIYYLTIHLIGKQILGPESVHHVSYETRALLQEIFQRIEDKMGLQLWENHTLDYFSLHFESLLTRLDYGIRIKNPQMNQLKGKYPVAFEMSVVAGQVILEHYGHRLYDDEMGYLAVYFAMAMERLQTVTKPKHIIVICRWGTYLDTQLKYKLTARYGSLIGKITCCKAFELYRLPICEYDHILTSFPISINFPIPVTEIDAYALLLQNDFQNLDRLIYNKGMDPVHIKHVARKEYFFYLDRIDSIEEGIRHILHEMAAFVEIPDNLYASVMERENLSSTSACNFIAMPRPIHALSKTPFLSVLILDKAMNWGNSKVKYIFLISPAKSGGTFSLRFIEMMSAFAREKAMFRKFIKSPDYETLTGIFNHLLDEDHIF